MENDKGTHFIICIQPPQVVPPEIMIQIKKLIENGGQVQAKYINIVISRALLVGYIISGATVIATCCLKRPQSSYRETVFSLAGAMELRDSFLLELGYITTLNGFEGKGVCQKLLHEFLKKAGKDFYATTRKESMAHIFEKFGFVRVGGTFKKDLVLFVNRKIETALII